MRAHTSTRERDRHLLHRISRVSGHLEANKRMIADGRYCIDIIHQNLAVIAALHKLNECLLDRHLRTCVVKAVQSKSPQRQKKVVREILEVYNKSKR